MVDSMPVDPVPSTNLKSTYFMRRGRFHEFRYTSPVFGLNAMSVALVPRDGNTLTVSPLTARSRISVSTGRPVSRSMCVAQLTLTNGFAAVQHIQKTVFVRAD